MITSLLSTSIQVQREFRLCFLLFFSCCLKFFYQFRSSYLLPMSFTYIKRFVQKDNVGKQLFDCIGAPFLCFFEWKTVGLKIVFFCPANMRSISVVWYESWVLFFGKRYNEMNHFVKK